MGSEYWGLLKMLGLDEGHSPEWKQYIQLPTAGSMPSIYRAATFNAVAPSLEEWRCLWCASLNERVKFNCRNCGAPR